MPQPTRAYETEPPAQSRGGMEFGDMMPTLDEYRNGKILPLVLEELNRFRWEILQQPNWRIAAQIEEDYYDSNQYDSKTLNDMADRGIPPIIVNLIGPTIDLVLGLEAKTRTDWIVRPEDEQYEDLALALSAQLKEVERETDADTACADAYANQIQAGVGWVEVSRESDPFKYRYRIKKRDWREFWWDNHSEERDLSDAMYLIRRRFYDRSLLMRYFPRKAGMIKAIGKSTLGFQIYDGRDFTEPPTLFRDDLNARDYTITELNWMDSWLGRDRLGLDEVWYRRAVRGVVLRTRDDRVMEFDPKNVLHRAALERGAAQLEQAVYMKTRVAFWIGPLQLWDMASPFPHNHFPYVPFWGFRENRTRMPYGLIRRMKPLQDEVNARRSKMLWGLSARRVLADSDAVQDHDAAREEIARPDAYVILNSKRRANSQFKVEDNFTANAQQMEAYQDATQKLQDSGGVYQTALGKAERGVTSGIAMATLVEQSTTTLAKINDNHRYGRRAVGNQAKALLVEDLKRKQNVNVSVDSPMGRKRVILNVPVELEGGIKALDNDVSKVSTKVVLDDITSSPTFRAQQFLQLTEMVKGLPPQLQAGVIDMVFEASDMPERKKFAERLRQQLGITSKPWEEMTPEEQDQVRKQMEEQDMLRKLGIKDIATKVDKQGADAEKSRAQTVKTLAEAAAVKQDMKAQDELLKSGVKPKAEVSFRW